MEKTVDSFFILIQKFTETHSFWDVFLCFWNFIGSMTIVLLCMWNANDLELKASGKEKNLLKLTLTFIAIGAFFHGVKIEVPDLSEGLIYSGLLIHLGYRRINIIHNNRK